MSSADPAVVVEYTDPLEGFKGWLVIDGTDRSLCAGGLRVQQTLTAAALKKMARNMSRKMRVWGMPINGAKSGIAYDPASPGKDAAVGRFMQAIKPFLLSTYSMGADLNTRMDTLEALAHSIGISSIKSAIAQAQGMSGQDYDDRYALLDEKVRGEWTLGSLRAGWGVGMAALALLKTMKISPDTAVAAVQGFGTLAKASIVALNEAGVKICALADAEKCLVDRSGNGLNVTDLLKADGTLIPLPAAGDAVEIQPRETVLSLPCDVLLLEAIENAITLNTVDAVHAKGVVPGANLAVAADAAEDLHARGIPVLPCFVAGSGGSVAMNGLFGPQTKPTAEEVLTFIQTSMNSMVEKLITLSREEGLTPTQIAMTLVDHGLDDSRQKPYAA